MIGGAGRLRPGVHSVMATPFLPDEAIDARSIRSLVDYVADAGADGVLVLGVLGGLGGVALIQELEAGSSGTMTGFALPDVLVRIVAAYHAGATETARRLFADYLPLIVFEAQPGAGVALRKEILRRRGAIAHATVRQPALSSDPVTMRSLDRLLEAIAAPMAR